MASPSTRHPVDSGHRCLITKTTRVPFSHSIGLALICAPSAVTRTLCLDTRPLRVVARPLRSSFAPQRQRTLLVTGHEKDCYFAKAAVPI